MFDNLRIGIKLPVIMVTVAAVTLIVVEMIALHNLRAAVIDSGRDRLGALSQARVATISKEVETIRSDLHATARSPLTLAALRAFNQSWQRLGDSAPDTLQRLYAGEGTAGGRRQRLDRHSYVLVHNRFHEDFEAQRTARGYDDIYLVDSTGNVVYSATKGADFATRLVADELPRNGLEAAVGAASRARQTEQDKSTVFAPYGPADDAVVAFFASPVRSPFGTLEGIVVYRISADHLAMLASGAAGIGAGGTAGLYGSGGAPIGDAPPVAASIVEAALGGGAGVVDSVAMDGVPVMAAFAPLDLLGHRYALVMTQPLDEILAPMTEIRTRLLRDGLVALIALSLLSVVVARSMSVPLTGVGRAMEDVARGDYATDIPGAQRADEIGLIARKLDSFRASLVDADALARETAFKGAAFEGASAALMLVDGSLTILYVNQALKDMIAANTQNLARFVPEVSQGPIVGRNLVVLFHGAPRLVERLEREQARTCSQEVGFGQCTFRFQIGAVTSPGNDVLGYVVEVQDVTETHLQQTLLDAVARSHLVAEFGADGRMVRANANFLAFTGAAEGGATGLRWNDLFAWRGAGAAAEPDPWDRLRGGDTLAGRIWGAVRKGACPADATLCPVTDGQGRLKGAVLLAIAAAGAGNVADLSGAPLATAAADAPVSEVRS